MTATQAAAAIAARPDRAADLEESYIGAGASARAAILRARRLARELEALGLAIRAGTLERL